MGIHFHHTGNFRWRIFCFVPFILFNQLWGAYWVWMLLLFCFVLQAVSYEFHSKPGNIFGANTYRAFLFINGVLGTFLLGVAIGTFFTGSAFSVNKENILSIGNAGGGVISRWENPFHGLEALGNFRNLCLGLSLLFLARTLAALFFVNRLDHVALVEKSKKYVVYNGIPFVIFFLIFLVRTLLTEGFAVDPGTGMVAMEKMKYLHNFMQMPIVLVMFLLGVAAVLYGIAGTVFKNDFRKGIWYSGIGTVLTVTMLLLIAGYNHTAYYPSTYDLQSSLTIQNSSSSELTLRVMFYVSLLVPIVIGYIAYAWRLLEKKRLSIEDLKADEHAY